MPLSDSHVRNDQTPLSKSTRSHVADGLPIIVKDIIMLNVKEDCAHYLATRFRTNATWRIGKAVKFPSDGRNALAAQQLLELKSGIEITDAMWDRLSPHYDETDACWCAAVSATNGHVGFRQHPGGFCCLGRQLVVKSDCKQAGADMTNSNIAFADGISRAAFYHRDPTVPFWHSNVDADQLFGAHAHRPDRAQAWLRYRKVSESCSGFERAVLMKGHFELGLLGYHSYHWTFTPTHIGDLAIVLPVYEDCRLADFIAICRHDHEIWGCCTGAGQSLGDITTPLRIHRSPANWLANDCDGVLPLSKGFFPLLQNAPSIIAEDDDHAWDIAYRVFIDPAARFSSDQDAAEQLAYNRIEVRS